MVLLLALASAKRVGDLAALSIHLSCMVFSEDKQGVTLTPNPVYLPKIITSGCKSLVIVPPHPPPPPLLSAQKMRNIFTHSPLMLI